MLLEQVAHILLSIEKYWNTEILVWLASCWSVSEANVVRGFSKYEHNFLISMLCCNPKLLNSEI